MSNNKFNFEYMTDGDTDTVCFNKKKYTKKKALRLGSRELLNISDYNDFEVSTGFIRFGDYINHTGDKVRGWSIYFGQRERKYEDEIEVWIVEGFE